MDCLECHAPNPEEAANCRRCSASLRPARVKLYLERATQAMSKGRAELASANLRQADLEMIHISLAERERHLFTAHAFMVQGGIYYANGQTNEAREKWRLAVERLEEQPDGKDLLSKALGRLGNVSYYMGEVEQAITYYQRSSELAAEIGSHVVAAKTLTNLSNMYLEGRSLPQAREYLARALTQSKLSDDPVTLAEVYRVLSWFHINYGPASRALDYAALAYDLVSQVESVETRSVILGEVGYVHACYGDLAPARGYIYESYTLAQQSGTEIAKEHVAKGLAELIRQGHPHEAWFGKVMRAVEGQARGVMMRWEVELCQAIYYISLGSEEKMRHHLQTLTDSNAANESAAAAVGFDHAAALLHAALGEWDAAAICFKQARAQGKLTDYEQAMTWVEQADMLMRRAEVENHPASSVEAEAAFKQATDIFHQLELPLRIAQIQAKLSASDKADPVPDIPEAHLAT